MISDMINMDKKIPLIFPPINKLGNSAFRRLCLNHGADYVFTEMIRIEKLLENEEHQLRKLFINDEFKNRTLVQIISENIDLIEKGVEKIVELFPEVKEINYNMGCPQSSLCKKECGAGILNNSILVGKVANKLKIACDKYKIIPSIKMRLGIIREEITIYKNVKEIKKNGIKKIYIHGRTLSDTYLKPATYEEIARVKKENPKLKIIGNGDIRDYISFKKMILMTNCDGILIGRAALEDPSIFEKLKKIKYSNNKPRINRFDNLSGIELSEKLPLIKELIEYGIQEKTSIPNLKANISYMTKGVINGSNFRKDLNNTKNNEEILNLINSY